MKLSRWKRESIQAIREWNPDELLAELDRRRFQTTECIDSFLTRIEDTIPTDPHLALRLAKRGPEYARHAGNEYEARAWCFLGHVQKTLGDLESATKSFKEALEVLGSHESAEAASVWWHYSSLLGDRGLVDQALEYAKKAVSYFQRHRDGAEVDSCDRLSLAAALNREAIILSKSGLKTSKVACLFLAALQETNEKTPKTIAVTSKNFAAAAVVAWMEGEPGFRADEVLQRIARVKRDLEGMGYDRHTLWGARLQWAEGIGRARLASAWTPAAEHHIEMARSTLLELGAKQDVILINLDEGYWHAREGSWKKLETLAQKTLELAENLGLDQEKQAALRQWLIAIKARTVETHVFESVYREVRGVTSLDLETSTIDDSSPTGW